MRHFGFYTLFMILISVSAVAQDKHLGHKHKKGEECELPGTSSSAIDKLDSAIKKVEKNLELPPQFCAELKTCGYSRCENYVSDLKSTKAPCNMTLLESIALTEYMGGGYRCINRSLYDPNDTTETKNLVSTINSALEKFPKYEGFVARGSHLPQEIIDEHMKSEIIKYKAFTSTSTDPGIAKSFGASYSTSFLIYSFTGRPVMGYMGGEREVLFKSDTNFKILHFKKPENTSTHYFLMREVLPNETKALAAERDAFVIESAKGIAAQKDPNPSDSYVCPTEGKEVEKVIKQKNLPDFGEAAVNFIK